MIDETSEIVKDLLEVINKFVTNIVTSASELRLELEIDKLNECVSILSKVHDLIMYGNGQFICGKNYYGYYCYVPLMYSQIHVNVDGNSRLEEIISGAREELLKNIKYVVNDVIHVITNITSKYAEKVKDIAEFKDVLRHSEKLLYKISEILKDEEDSSSEDDDP